MRRAAAVLVTLAFAITAQAGEVEWTKTEIDERWRCYALLDYDQKQAIVDALRLQPPKDIAAAAGQISFGTVKVAGIIYRSLFFVDGFNREWRFGPRVEFEARDDYPYGLRILPDGTGFYFDLKTAPPGEPVEWSQAFKCKMSRK